MAIQPTSNDVDYSNMVYQDQTANSGFNISQLFSYFMSWFQSSGAGAPQGYTSPTDQAYYNLGMQDQWQNLTQPSSINDFETARQTEVQAKISVEQNKFDEIDSALKKINGDPAISGAISRVGDSIANPRRDYENGGFMNFYAGFLSQESRDKVAPLLDKYSFTFSGKVSLDGNGKVRPQDTVKALYYVSEFLKNEKASSQFTLNNLRLQQDAGYDPTAAAEEIDDE